MDQGTAYITRPHRVAGDDSPGASLGRAYRDYVAARVRDQAEAARLARADVDTAIERAEDGA